MNQRIKELQERVQTMKSVDTVKNLKNSKLEFGSSRLGLQVPCVYEQRPRMNSSEVLCLIRLFSKNSSF